MQSCHSRVITIALKRFTKLAVCRNSCFAVCGNINASDQSVRPVSLIIVSSSADAVDDNALIYRTLFEHAVLEQYFKD